jgi:WhiB family transcriptional regulator, redox-sensing transcriptional regulator
MSQPSQRGATTRTVDQPCAEPAGLTALPRNSEPIDPIGRRSPRGLPCHVHDPDLWFAESPGDIDRAKALCATCPVRRECLAGALRRSEPCGVWGGEIVQRGQVIPFKRGRGRPRIHFPAAGDVDSPLCRRRGRGREWRAAARGAAAGRADPDPTCHPRFHPAGDAPSLSPAPPKQSGADARPPMGIEERPAHGSSDV